MKKEDKYLNFFGDSQDYTFHNPVPNPFGLRGNPDTQANSVEQGDGLNGTPNYRSFTGEVQDDAWSNHPGFLGGIFGGGNNDTDTDVDGGELPAVDLGTVPSTEDNSSGGGFISGLFGGGDGMKTYYNCQNGVVITGSYKKGDQPTGWGTSRRDACLTPQEISDRKKQLGSTIGNILNSLNEGYKTGAGLNKPTSPQFDPSLNPVGNASTTTTTTQAGLGGNSKLIGWVLVGAVVLGLGYLAIKSSSAPKPEFYND